MISSMTSWRAPDPQKTKNLMLFSHHLSVFPMRQYFLSSELLPQAAITNAVENSNNPIDSAFFIFLSLLSFLSLFYNVVILKYHDS